MENDPAKPDGRNHPGVRRAGCPHPAGPCGGGNVCGRDKSLPYKPRWAHGQPENHKPCFITNLCRGRCLHRPRKPCGGATPRGRIWNPPLRPTAKCCGQPGNRKSYGVARAGVSGCVTSADGGTFSAVAGVAAAVGIRGCGNLSACKTAPVLQPRPPPVNLSRAAKCPLPVTLPPPVNLSPPAKPGRFA